MFEIATAISNILLFIFKETLMGIIFRLKVLEATDFCVGHLY